MGKQNKPKQDTKQQTNKDKIIYCGKCKINEIDKKHFDTDEGLCKKCLSELENNIINDFKE